MKLELQLKLLNKISDQLTEEFAQSQFNLLQKLKGKLLQASSRLETSSSEELSLKRKTSDYLRKLKHAFVKDSLDELVSELEAWLSRFDPSWYLLILMHNNSVDSALVESRPDIATGSSKVMNPVENMIALRQAMNTGTAAYGTDTRPTASLNLDIAGLRESKVVAVPLSATRAILRKGSSQLLISEAVDCPSSAISRAKVDVESLARKLQQVDPDTFGLLRCYGLLKYRDPVTNGLAAIEVVYRAPPDSKPPTSVRQLLLAQEPVSLSAILKLVKQLVRSVSYIHACDFVHKNIRPDNILIFPSDTSPLGPTFLVGFNQFRSANFQTNLTGDPAWHRNLYRHPQRQGIYVQERYVMQHDIYSLGVCMLEIGLWQSFVWYRDGNDGAGPVPSLPLGLEICDADFGTTHPNSPFWLKEHLVALAKRELPPRLGNLYTGIVLACLTCLDPGNGVFGRGQELEDEDGIIVGIRFVENILMKIDEISI